MKKNTNNTMSTINTIIAIGLDNSPENMGMSGQFYKPMWAKSHEEFVERLIALYSEGDRLYDSAYYGTGNAGPIGEVKVISQKGYTYVYLIDSYGNWEARLFSHNIIARDYPSYKGYKIALAKEEYKKHLLDKYGYIPESVAI